MSAGRLSVRLPDFEPDPDFDFEPDPDFEPCPGPEPEPEPETGEIGMALEPEAASAEVSPVPALDRGLENFLR